MNDKKIITILSILTLIALGIVYKFRSSNHQNKSLNQHSKSTSGVQTHTEQIKPVKKNDNDKIKAENIDTPSLSPALKKTLSAYQHRLGSSAQINITKLGSKKINFKADMRQVEEVRIEIKRGTERSSFQAYVDSESGDVLQTWNQVRKEGLFYKEQKHSTFKPTGEIKK